MPRNARQPAKPQDPSGPKPWTVADAARLYRIDAWGRGCFSVNDSGRLVVRPDDTPGPGLDLNALVDELRERGIDPPLMIRFSDLLKARVTEIHGAFHQAVEEFEYRGTYRGVYPVKVNQDRFLVEDLVTCGRRFHYSLEAGSKPELLAVIAMLSDPEAVVICNGYKDEEYIETALLASRLGPEIILVVEKFAELSLILEVARRTGVVPRLGIRARLATPGAGHWEASGGDRSKFGLGARALVEAVELLRREEMLASFVLLHFHQGSQISAIRNLKQALREGTQIYAQLVKMGAPLRYLDVGGGLGVDYDGSQSDSGSSVNYSLREYANDVVYGVIEVCDPAGVEHPILLTEAGRATVAHHALLVVEVIGVGELRAGEIPETVPPGTEAGLSNMLAAYQELGPENVRETYHDALQYREECQSLFNLGHLSLEHRGLSEDIFWAVCHKAKELVRGLAQVPAELQGLDATLADTYFCNFSVFQSIPDSWAIDQLFPVVPIHRLDERPDRLGVIADMTCDSDGKIDRFIHPDPATDRERPILDLHKLGSEPYYLGIFLVGAYQEILGDMHNLFGDTNIVHVALDEDGGYRIEHVVEGDTVTEMLQYVGYERSDLVARLRRNAEESMRAGRMSRGEARQLLRKYEEGLAGYTYLERD